MGDIEKDEQKEMIVKYMKLKYTIRHLQDRLDGLQYEFYDQSFNTRTDSTPLGIYVRGFRIEDEVADYLDSMSRVCSRLKKKKKISEYFNNYLNTLSHQQKKYLHQRYLMGHDVPVQEDTDEATIEEIREIEEAICYMNGVEPDTLNGVVDSTKLNFEQMLEVLDL